MSRTVYRATRTLPRVLHACTSTPCGTLSEPASRHQSWITSLASDRGTAVTTNYGPCVPVSYSGDGGIWRCADQFGVWMRSDGTTQDRAIEAGDDRQEIHLASPSWASSSGSQYRFLRASTSSVFSRLLRSCRSLSWPFLGVHWPSSRGPARFAIAGCRIVGRRTDAPIPLAMALAVRGHCV